MIDQVASGVNPRVHHRRGHRTQQVHVHRRVAEVLRGVRHRFQEGDVVARHAELLRPRKHALRCRVSSR